MKTHAPLGTLCLSFPLLLTACGSADSVTLGEPGGPNLASVLVSPEEGGSLVVDASADPALTGLILDVPAGAVAADTEITVEASSDLTGDDEGTWAGPAVRFGPAGLQFELPATVHLPVNGTLGEDEELRVRIENEDGSSEWVEAEAIGFDGSLASIEVDHFTAFQPSRRSASAMTRRCRTQAARAYRSCLSGTATSTRSRGRAAQCRAQAAQVFQTCTSTATAPACTTDADCSRGLQCNTTTGQCERTSGGNPAHPPRCRTDADCPTGAMCNTRTNQCERTPTGGRTRPPRCRTDADCPTGAMCNTRTNQCERTATGGGGSTRPTRCRSDADCPTGQTCDTTNNVCQ